MHAERKSLTRYRAPCRWPALRPAKYSVTMLPADEPALSKSEWIVLSLVCEGPTHGNAVTRLLGQGGDLGQIWRVQRGEVYRCLDRLSDLGLIRSAGKEPSPRGPVRSLVEATEAGQAAARSWQPRPVQHPRDIR